MRSSVGTLAILRSLLTYIQSEAHPIYRAGQRNTLRWLMTLDPTQWGGLLFFLLLLAVPICAFLQSAIGTPARLLAGYHDELLDLILLVAGGLLSLTWTVPFAMLAGQGISHERATQTWDTLLITPYPTDVILLAKAAADIRLVWGRVTTTVLISVLIALSMIATTILARSASIVIGIIFIAITVITVIIE